MLIVGVSGVTNGGKTTLARALHKALPNSHLICQDTYFHPADSKKHIWIPELNHINWEIMSSLDMDKMWQHISDIVKEGKFPECLGGDNNTIDKEQSNTSTISLEDSSNGIHYRHEIGVLIIEGFLILNYKPISDICHLKYHLTLDQEECRNRRNTRVYDPPDVPGFFDLCVWPEYVRHKEEMLKEVRDVKVIDGTQNMKAIFRNVLGEIVDKLDILKVET